MLNELKGELVRRGLVPYKAIMDALSCSDKTARNKLNGITAFTIPEAKKIVSEYFKDADVDIGCLFAKDNEIEQDAV